MSTPILGIVLIVVGVVAIVAGIGGGIAKMFIEIKQQAKAASFGALDSLLPVETIQALTKFLEALVKAPLWLALVIIGILLVAWGGTML